MSTANSEPASVKMTPAHDPNDFDIGRRHNLPEIDVMTDDAKMNEAAGPYAGLDRFDARERIVDRSCARWACSTRITDHTHAVGTCDRCGTVVEPRLSLQWFVKMAPLAKPAIAAVERGDIEIVPENRRTEYFEWMRNIRDWCISRQLWWGHRIPGWHCERLQGNYRVARTTPDSCAKCGSAAARAGNRCARNVVQLGAVAVLHAGLAGRYRRITAPTIRPAC